LYEPQFQFDWDEAKAVGNLHKHGISFELASSVFSDPRILTIADLEHSELEERWFSRLGQQWGNAFSRVSLEGIRKRSNQRFD